MGGFGKREQVATQAFPEAPTARQLHKAPPRSAPNLEIPSIGTARTLKAMLVYCAALCGLLGSAAFLLLVEHPFSYATAAIAALSNLID